MVENFKQKLFCWGFLTEVPYFEKKIKFSVALRWQKPSKMLTEFLIL